MKGFLSDFKAKLLSHAFREAEMSLFLWVRTGYLSMWFNIYTSWPWSQATPPRWNKPLSAESTTLTEQSQTLFLYACFGWWRPDWVARSRWRFLIVMCSTIIPLRHSGASQLCDRLINQLRGDAAAVASSPLRLNKWHDCPRVLIKPRVHNVAAVLAVLKRAAVKSPSRPMYLFVQDHWMLFFLPRWSIGAPRYTFIAAFLSPFLSLSLSIPLSHTNTLTLSL